MKTMRRALCAAIIIFLAAGCSLATADSVLALPEDLQVIEQEAFLGVKGAVKAVIPEGVTSIESRAFAESAITEVSFPDNIESIADDAFEGAPLSKVIANEGTVGYDWAQAHEIPVSSGVTKLTWVVGTSPAPADNELVMAKLNEISLARLGVKVEIIYMSSDEVGTSIANGELYDMYFTNGWFNSYNNNIANGVFLDITNSLPQVAPALYATMPESIWNIAKTKNGRLYGIPIKKDYAPMYFVVYDADIADQAGITVPDTVSSLAELTDYLVALKSAMDQDPSLGDYPVVNSGDIYGLDGDFDYIDQTSLIGVHFGGAQVCSLLDDEEVMDRYRTLYSWYEMGLVKIGTEGEGGEDKAHSIRFVQSWTGFNYSSSTGYRAKMVRYAGPVVKSEGVKSGLTAFSYHLADDPERLALCLEYQELVNTDRQYRDILAYGVPGVHFNYSGDYVQRTALGNSNYTPWQFAQGSYAVKSVEVGNGSADQWTRYFAEADNGQISRLGGFTFDYHNPIDFSAQYAAISAIRDELMPGLKDGTADADAVITEMRTRMNAAGLQQIIAEAQRQLNVYLGAR